MTYTVGDKDTWIDNILCNRIITMENNTLTSSAYFGNCNAQPPNFSLYL